VRSLTRKDLLLAAALSAAWAGCHSASGGGGRVSLINLAGSPGSLTFRVAFQDGDGPWQAVPGKDGVHSFESSSGRYGVAFVCAGALAIGEVVHATVAELPELRTRCGGRGGGAAATQRLTITVRNRPAGSEVWVQFHGPSLHSVPFMDRSSLTLSGLPTGTYDVLAVAGPKGTGQDFVHLRDVVVVSETTLDLDFAGPDRVAPITSPLVIKGAPPTPALEGWIGLWSRAGTFAGWRLAETGKPLDSFTALDGEPLIAGEDQELTVVTGWATGVERGAKRSFRRPVPFEVTLPSDTAATLSLSGASSRRPQVRFAASPGTPFRQLLAYYKKGGSLERSWLATFTESWLEGRTSYTIPDLSRAAGFDPAWQAEPQELLWLESLAISDCPSYARILAGAERQSLRGADLGFVKHTETLPIGP
jgi:hypothetical protein